MSKDMKLLGGLAPYSVKYYSPSTDAFWHFDDEDVEEPSLQVVYKREVHLSDSRIEKQDFWMYLDPDDAIRVGNLLVAWGKSYEEAKE